MNKFKSVDMEEVNLFLLGDDLERVANILFDLKLMEFFKFKKEDFQTFSATDNSKISSELLSLRSTISYLTKFYTQDSTKTIENPIEKTLEAIKEEKELSQKILSLEDDLRRQKVLASLKVNSQDVLDKKKIVGFIPKEDKSNLKLLKKNSKHNIVTYTLDKRVYFSVSAKSTIPFSYKEFYLPKKVSLSLPLKIKELKERKETLLSKVNSIANASLSHLKKEELRLSKKAALLENRVKFNKTDNFTVVSGYVPSTKISGLRNSLEKELGDSFELKRAKAKGDNVPTQLHNPGSSGNYESLLKMYSFPKYGEFDPTFLMFLIFPIFYGMIMGDVIYGILSLALFSFLKTKYKQVKEFISILQISSISSIIFGILYGEYLGFEASFFGFEFSRLADPISLLYISLALGVLHLNLGLFIGFFQDWGESKYHAIMDKLVWILLQISVASISIGMIMSISILATLGWVLFAIVALMLVKEHGFLGITEIPSFFTNVLSYARLMAVGLSSVVIGLLVNKYSFILLEGGIISSIFGIMLFIVGHTFNIVVGNFASFINSLRLHYVEFFPKFYSGSGREFKPYGSSSHPVDE